MNLSQINTSTLRQILKLSERKDLLLKEVNKIDIVIENLFKGNTKVHPSVTSEPSSLIQSKAKKVKQNSEKNTGRKMIKESILKALVEAGSLGITINELSKQLGIKKVNLYVWFSNVGKKIQGLEKIAPGHFRLHSQEEEKAVIQPPQEEIKQDPLSLY